MQKITLFLWFDNQAEEAANFYTSKFKDSSIINVTCFGEAGPGPDQNLLKYGTGTLDRTLLENDLVDEFHFWIFPVTVGGGQHLFDGIDNVHLKLVDTTRFGSGVVVLTYVPERAQERQGERATWAGVRIRDDVALDR